MAYPDNKEDFTPVVSPEFIQQLDVNELQTLLETLQDIIGLFPNWGGGAIEDIGNIFKSKIEIVVTGLSALNVGGLLIRDDGNNLGIFLEDGGNIGIKNQTPAVALDVTGNIQASEGVFEDRGDPAAYDFALGDLTTDGTWRDLDLSSIVPAGAKTVCLEVIIQDDAVNSSIQLRKNGNSNTNNRSIRSTQVANIVFYADMLVACDTDRKIEYNATNTTWDGIYILVKGWWR